MNARYRDALLRLAVGVGATTVASAAVAVGAPGLMPLLSPQLLGMKDAVEALAPGVAADAAKKGGELLCESALSSSWAAVSAQLAGVRADQGLPPNHHLMRAIRQSWLLALRHCIHLCSEDVLQYRDASVHDPSVEKQLRKVDLWIDLELTACLRPDYFRGLFGAESETALPEGERSAPSALLSGLEQLVKRAVNGTASTSAGALFAELFSSALEDAINELADVLGAPVLGPVQDWLYGCNVQQGDEHGWFAPGWRLAAAAFFAQLVKHDPILGATVLHLRSEKLGERMDSITACLGGLGQRIADMDQRLAQFQAQLRLDTAQRANLLESMARGSSAEAIVRALRMAFPRGTRWTQTASQVRERLARLQGIPLPGQRGEVGHVRFVGREEDLLVLDRFLVEQPRGLAVIASPPGYGKSALLAAWVRRRADAKDTVVRHFISTSHDATRSELEVNGHLMAQLNEIFERPGPEPDGVEALRQNLHATVSARAVHMSEARDRKLIIVLDGLDEARVTIAPFLEHDLADGVYVVVSCRASVGLCPEVLRPWEERRSVVPFVRHDLKGLSQDNVLTWLRQLKGNEVGVTQERLLVRQLWTASDQGVALFLSMLLDDWTRDRVTSTAVGFGAVDLASFERYVYDQFQRLRGAPPAERREVWTNTHQWLIAVLSVALGPLTGSDLRGVLLRLRLDGQPIHSTSAEELLCDHRLTRWLQIDGLSGPQSLVRYSLAHPYLARPLAMELGDLATEARKVLVRWADEAWRRSEGDVSDYPLDWLPELWMHVDVPAAVRLMHDPHFLLSRMADPVNAAARLQMATDEWARLDTYQRDTPAAQTWSAFLSESEPVLLEIARAGVTAERPLQVVVRDCLGDSAICDADGVPIPPRALAAHMPHSVSLLRTVERAHYSRLCVVAVGDYFVSFGDTAVRWWTSDGRSLPERGSLNAHEDGAAGIASAGECAISWGIKGSLRCWTLDGHALEQRSGPLTHSGNIQGVLPLTDGQFVICESGGGIWWCTADGLVHGRGSPVAHAGGASGLLHVGDGVVSWGEDGALRWWTLDGLARQALSVTQAHEAGVNGVLKAGHYLVSWGDDGALCWWTLQGKDLHNSVDFGPAGVSIRGVERVRDTLVSWERPGVLRWWTLDGQRLEANDGTVHGHSLAGALSTGDHLVSWGFDGAIRWWTPNGELLSDRGGMQTGGSSIRGAESVGSHIVSWSRNGALCWWTLDGHAVPHLNRSGIYFKDSRIQGVAWLPNRVVSWGNDGALRWWASDHPPFSNGHLNETSHDSGVMGVLAVCGLFVSWDYHGAIYWWTREGCLLPDRGGRHAHQHRIDGVIHVNESIVSWCAGGALRWWTLDGRPLTDRGDPHAHRGYIDRVQKVGQLVVSRARDEPSRCWTLDGFALPLQDIPTWPLQGATEVSVDHPSEQQTLKHPSSWPTLEGRARRGEYDWKSRLALREEVITVSGNVVSYGVDGSLSWWTPDGDLLPDRGDPQAHAGGIEKVVAIGGNFLSWGRDGVFRLWSSDGRAIPTLGCSHGYKQPSGMTRAIKNGLAVAEGNGTLRWWTVQGQVITGRIVEDAHTAPVNGVISVFDHLVSWGDDGAIRWWTLEGETLADRGDARAHPDGVICMLLGKESLISYGKDGLVRFWSFEGRPLAALAVPGGVRDAYVCRYGDNLIVASRSIWVYDLSKGWT